MVEDFNPEQKPKRDVQRPEDVTKAVENIDDVEVKKPSKWFDASIYNGMKVPLEKPNLIWVTDWYTGPADAEGNPTYNPHSTELKKVVEIKTVPLKELDENGNPTDKILKIHGNPIQISARLNLKKELNADGSVNWVISKHPRAKLWTFMQQMQKGMTKLSELEGKIVLLTTKLSNDPNDDRVYLRIVI
jgi:hypothetical protein